MLPMWLLEALENSAEAESTGAVVAGAECSSDGRAAEEFDGTDTS